MAKRAFDLLMASVGLLVLSPLLIVVGIAILLDDGPPVLFRQERVGRDGRLFRMLKFRTMRADAERRGGLLTVRNDPRITRVGAALRKSKLDELPQLINVVVGDMSLVGPRPEVPRYVAWYDERQRSVLRVRPGITDPASIAYRDENELLATHTDPDEVYRNEIMPAKLELNLAYLERRSLAADIGIIFKTLARLVDR